MRRHNTERCSVGVLLCTMSRQVFVQSFYLFWCLFITSSVFILAPDDESKYPDVEEAKSQDVEEAKTQDCEEGNSSDDEQDNTPIAASIVLAPKSKRPATQKRKEKRQNNVDVRGSGRGSRNILGRSCGGEANPNHGYSFVS